VALGNEQAGHFPGVQKGLLWHFFVFFWYFFSTGKPTCHIQGIYIYVTWDRHIICVTAYFQDMNLAYVLWAMGTFPRGFCNCDFCKCFFLSGFCGVSHSFLLAHRAFLREIRSRIRQLQLLLVVVVVFFGLRHLKRQFTRRRSNVDLVVLVLDVDDGFLVIVVLVFGLRSRIELGTGHIAEA